MLDDKENLLQKNKLFNIRKDRKKKTAYEKARSFYFVLSIIVSLVIIAATYFLSSVSNVYRISVDGNIYLKDEDIIQMSGLSEKSKYLLVMPFQVREKIKKNELIEDVKVERLEGRLVKISVKEKKIVGYAPENGLNVLIVDNGEKIGIGKDQMYLIASGPIIEGFDEEGLVTLAKQLNKCDSKIIKEISEIHRYPELKYQDVELVMREKDGERFVFALNYTAEEQILTWKKPVRSLTKGAPMAGKQVLAPYGVEVVDLKYRPRVRIREDALPNLALFRE